ncbi:hypothetical protein Q8A67_019581 [Cirrhinus molitorella]|uniref:Uncharacterized protein n=1 Tax=Cirrhinus molitorella TaxID=172907 RepID=A0AA88P7F0_9TELE|nr:hypothetical protein Q8A67_019581 [Cirrhinus molitorella]
MMVALPNGTVVHHINANYFLDQTSMKPEEEEGPAISFSAEYWHYAKTHRKQSFGLQLNHTAAGKLPWALIYHA